MVQLENILRTPPLVVTALYIAGSIPFPPPGFRIFSDEYWTLTVAPVLSVGVLLFIFVFAWLWSLYEASIARLPSHARRGQLIFMASACRLVLAFAIGQILDSWNGAPPAYLLIAFALTFFPASLNLVAIWLAAKVFREFEKSKPNALEWDAFFAVLVLVIGIWFVYRRIQTMLVYPRLTDQPA